MHYILDKNDEPVKVDLMTWANWFEDESRTIAKTTVGEMDISTVFLGLDHSFGKGEPLLFETMIFGGKHDQNMWRYSTWEEAVAGHKAARELVSIKGVRNEKS